MDTFLFEMSMKWMFTFKNFRNVYWHGKTHSALYPSWPNLLGDRPSITFWGFFFPDESVGHQIIANWYLILLWVKNLYRKDIHLRYLGGARLLAGATEILFVHSCQVLHVTNQSAWCHGRKNVWNSTDQKSKEVGSRDANRAISVKFVHFYPF